MMQASLPTSSNQTSDSETDLYPTSPRSDAYRDTRFEATPRLDNFHPDFASSDGDVILASRDCQVMFRTHSYILKTASGWFKSMFSLPRFVVLHTHPRPPLTRPQHSPTSSAPQTPDIIYLNDSATTLEHLLRMVSGLPLLPLDSCELVDAVLHAAETYEMAGAMSIIRLAITTAPLSDSPLHMYGLCCRYGWEVEAQTFLTRTLALNIHDPVHRPTLSRLSTTALLDLFALHRIRREV